MTFDEWWEITERIGDCFHDIAKAAWDAATEEVKKDHFKLGEEVEMFYRTTNIPLAKGVVKAITIDNEFSTSDIRDVRRIPAWEPKDGEAVLWRDATGIARLGLYSDGSIYTSEGLWPSIIPMKPPRASAIGKPWDEV